MQGLRHNSIRAYANARALIRFALILVLIFSCRTFWILKYGTNIPFWDQWDTEVLYFWKRFYGGQLSLGDFFYPGNEHRIVFTKILNLTTVIFQNGQAKMLLPILIQNIIPSLYLALSIHWMRPLLNKYWLGFSLVFVLFTWPLAAENMFWAYQSQLYLNILFSLFALRIGTRRFFSFRKILPLLFLASLNQITIAAVLPVLCLFRALFWLEGKNRRDLVAIASLLFIGLWIIFIRADAPGLATYRAKNTQEFILTFANYLRWPGREKNPIGIFIFAPSFVFTLWALRERIKRIRFHSMKLSFLLAIFLWVMVLFLMAALGRAGSMHLRFFDYMLFLTFFSVSLWSLWKKLGIISKLQLRILTICFALILIPMLLRSLELSRQMHDRLELGQSVFRNTLFELKNKTEVSKQDVLRATVMPLQDFRALDDPTILKMFEWLIAKTDKPSHQKTH